MNIEELKNLKSKYEEVLAILERILLVHQFQRKRMSENEELVSKKKNMDLVQMNEWLAEIVSFYKENNMEISERDFHNMFPINNISYYRINEIINRYMKVFFENIDSLESDNFSYLVLHGMKDLGILADMNPVIDEIIMGINKNNHEHKSYFNQIIRDNVSLLPVDKNLKALGVDELDVIIDTIIKKMDDLSIQIDEIEKADVTSNNVYVEENDALLYNLCMMITSNRYDAMNDEEKKKLLEKIPEIIEMIIKLRIFGHVEKEYLEYSKDANYEKVLERVIEGEKTVAISKKRLMELVSEKKDIEAISSDKKGLLDVGFKKRISMRDASIREVDEKILNFGKNVIKYNEQNDELKKEYLRGFYNRFGDISQLEIAYNIRGIDSTDKLFGVFDFKKLPPSSASINEEYGDVLINLPDMNSLEFKKISELSLTIIKSLGMFVNEEDKISEFDISLEDVQHHKR